MWHFNPANLKSFNYEVAADVFAVYSLSITLSALKTKIQAKVPSSKCNEVYDRGWRYHKNKLSYLLDRNTILFGCWNFIWMLTLTHVDEKGNIFLGDWFKTLSAVFRMGRRFAKSQVFPRETDWQRHRRSSQQARNCNLFFACLPSHRWNVALTEVNNKIFVEDALVCVSLCVHFCVCVFIIKHTHW